MNSAALLAQHAKEFGLKPGQQVHILTTFLTVRIMFPELTLPQFLERAPALYGANDENRLNPKDAMDHWCPTKGSQWPPEKRITLMATYCDYLAGNPPAPVFTLNEALAFVLGDKAAAATPPPAAAPPQVQPPTAPLPPPPVQTVDASVPTMPAIPEPPAVAAAPVLTPPPGGSVPIIPVGAQQLEAVVRLTADDRRKANEYLAMTAPIGTVALGKQLVETVTDMGTFVLHVDVVNAQPSPFVDLFCRDKSGTVDPIAEMTPQQVRQIEGTYQMLLPNNAVLIINIP